MPCRLSPLASRRASSAASPNLLHTHSCFPVLHLSSSAFKHNQKLASKKDDQSPMLETKQNEKIKWKHLPLTSTVSQNRWSCRKKSALGFQEEEVNPQAEQQHSPREGSTSGLQTSRKLGVEAHCFFPQYPGKPWQLPVASRPDSSLGFAIPNWRHTQTSQLGRVKGKHRPGLNLPPS